MPLEQVGEKIQPLLHMFLISLISNLTMEFSFSCLLLMKGLRDIGMTHCRLSKETKKFKVYLFLLSLTRNFMDGPWTKLLESLAKPTIVLIVGFLEGKPSKGVQSSWDVIR